jgi:poly-gamma-glutamate capsule biosynthesis protein CapA/YwtB (metallophosphatase superfamily)
MTLFNRFNNKSVQTYTMVEDDIAITNNSNSTLSPEVTPKPITSTDILISCAGDCTLGSDDKTPFDSSLPGVLKANNEDYSYLFKNVSSIFKLDDITTVNLETTFTNATTKSVKSQPAFNFKGSPDFVKALSLGSIEGVNISNNHIYDYLAQGINDTKNTLKDNSIGYFGEGEKWIKEIKGIKIGFLGYTGWSYDAASLKKIKEDIQTLKEQCSLVIVNFHWGIELQYYPNDVQKHLAHYAIDSGADFIIGHHPHVIEGIEKYKNKIICYSLGNFCFGGNTSVGDNQTFIFQTKIHFLDNKISSYDINFIPCSISSVDYKNDYRPTPLKGELKQAVFNKLNKISFSPGFLIKDGFLSINVNNQSNT